MVRIIALDTETTGKDLYHSARPFLVTICDNDGKQRYWQWDVDPLTRKVAIDSQDVEQIAKEIRDADIIVGQNVKFDYTALRNANERFVHYWDWSKVRDTLLAGHLLDSAHRHNLTDMTMYYLRKNIKPYEDRLAKAVQEARRVAKRRFPKWKIAKEGMVDDNGEQMLPSAKSGSGGKGKESGNAESKTPWRNDYWLPQTMANAIGANYDGSLIYPLDHTWRIALPEYASQDSAATLALWIGMGSYPGMEREIKRRGLWEIYLQRLKLIRIAYNVESGGAYYSDARVSKIEKEFRDESTTSGRCCVNIASSFNYNLQLPKGASPNQSLRNFFYTPEGLGLNAKDYAVPKKGKKKAKSDTPPLDKEVLAKMLLSLPRDSKAYVFVKHLLRKRKLDTNLAYIAGYRRFGKKGRVVTAESECGSCGLPCYSGLCNVCGWKDELEGYYRIHPSNNITGSGTLRWSYSDPNLQNVSKAQLELEGEVGTRHSLRYGFGPAPGREWWVVDAQNIELRIPSFKAPEPDLINVFLHPKDPPYFGSYHLVVFDALHPELFAKHGVDCKELFESTWYQWVKNGNFAVIYGAQEDTADRTYRVEGAYQKIKYRFPNLAAFNERTIKFAEKHGYIETIPNKFINPDRGYPLQLVRNEYHKIEPTKPFNYLVQGTAMQWTADAMILCQEQLDKWHKQDSTFDGRIVLQVHDEIDFDFPKRGDPLLDLAYEKEHGKLPLFRTKSGLGSSNLWRIRQLQKLCEKCGEGIGVPTPTGVKYCADNWEEGVKV